MKFTARDHAFVYGVIAEEVMSRCSDAETILEDAIKVYIENLVPFNIANVSKETLTCNACIVN